jgi:hypothetical protein
MNCKVVLDKDKKYPQIIIDVNGREVDLVKEMAIASADILFRPETKPVCNIETHLSELQLAKAELQILDLKEIIQTLIDNNEDKFFEEWNGQYVLVAKKISSADHQDSENDQ